MALFDFFSKMQETVDKYSDHDYLKMDADISTRVKKRLTALEGTVSDMKAHDAKLQKELEQAEAIKYGREEKPDYSGKGFAAFITATEDLAEERAKAKTVEQVQLELREFKRFKEPFLKQKLNEIDEDLQVLKQQQTAKLREIETSLETAGNVEAINAIYSVLVTEYHRLVRRVELLANYCPNYWYTANYERIEHKSIKEQQSESMKYTAQKDTAYWAMHNAAHNGGAPL